MISLSAITYDPAGTAILKTRISNPYDTRRRGSVTATLDGGVYPYDTGFSEADQTFRASIKAPSQALLLSLRYLISYYSQVRLSCEAGCFTVIPEYAMNGAQLTLQLRVLSRLDV